MYSQLGENNNWSRARVFRERKRKIRGCGVYNCDTKTVTVVSNGTYHLMLSFLLNAPKVYIYTCISAYVYIYKFKYSTSCACICVAFSFSANLSLSLSLSRVYRCSFSFLFFIFRHTAKRKHAHFLH